MPPDTPLPPPRPGDLIGEEQARPVERGAPRNEVSLSACAALLVNRGADFTIAKGAPDNDACAIDEPVTLKAIRLESGETISLQGAVTMRCALAVQIAEWVRTDLVSLAARHGLRLRALSGVGAHECRKRNHQAGELISEHATGNAFDVRRFDFESGPALELMVDHAEATRALREDIRVSACSRFTTVLGSGSDGFHEDHLHVDLRERRGGYRLCQWDVLN